MTAAFVDTNVIVYAFTTDPRAARAREILASGCVTSVQGLNKFSNVARRKLGMSWPEVISAVDAIRTLCSPISPIDVEMHASALKISERHGYAIFDSLMIAAALRSDCHMFCSEDMQDGFVIDSRLQIANPFK